MIVSIIVDGYCRVSTDPQEDNTSLDEQEACIRAYCAEHGLIIGMIHREIWSGFEYRERDKLSLMRDRYQEGKIQGVVVRTFDRLSRKQLHAAVLMDEMDHYGVAFHCVMEPVRSEDKAMDQFVRMVLAFVAEMEREKIMDRTMTGRRNAVLNGNMKAVSTHKMRYGFAWADETRTKIILKDTEVAPDQTEADIIRWMAEQYVVGVGALSLEQQLNDRNIPSPSGSTWRACTIIRILSDRRITGTNMQVFVNKATQYKTHHDAVDIPDGTYPQIVSPELFEKIQHRMVTNKIQATRSSSQPEEFLLRAGYVHCSVCGWGMGAKMPRSGYFVYRCRQHGSIASKGLDLSIWKKIEELADHVTLIEEAVQLASNDTRIQKEVASIETSIERWQKTAANYLKDLGDPELTGESRAGIRKSMNDANMIVSKLKGERAQLQAGLIDHEREQTAYQEILEWCREVKEARGELSYQRKRDFLELLGVAVTIEYNKEGHESTYDMRVKLPKLQALITLPQPLAESCDAHIEL